MESLQIQSSCKIVSYQITGQFCTGTIFDVNVTSTAVCLSALGVSDQIVDKIT